MPRPGVDFKTESASARSWVVTSGEGRAKAEGQREGAFTGTDGQEVRCRGA